MSQHTFVKFLKKYSVELSKDSVFDIARLADETKDNPRLIEPLILYGIYSDKKSTVLEAMTAAQVDELHLRLLRSYSPKTFSLLVLTSPTAVPIEYRKVFTSYEYRQSQMERDRNTKRLILEKVKRLMDANHLEREQILKVVPLDKWQVNDWLVYGADILSLDEARTVFHCTESLIERIQAETQNPTEGFQLTVQ